MSDNPHSNPADERVEQARLRHRQEQTRFFMVFAMIEGALLAAAVVIVYVLELIDPAQGIWLILAIVLLSGGVLSTYLLTRPQRNQREIAQIRRLG